MPNKRQILDAIANLAKKLGRTPTRAEFFSRSRISNYSLYKFFLRWNDAVRAAGLRPYTGNARIPDAEVLKDWGETARKNGAIPGLYVYRRYGKYDPNTLERRFGRWSEIPEAFRHFAKDKPEWADVVGLLPASAPPGTATKAAGRPNGTSLFAIPACKALHPAFKDRPAFGNPIAFPWLRYEPVNEQGVVLLFGMLAKDLGYRVESVQPGFPDCQAARQIAPERWQRVRIEFEFESRNFREHGHPSGGCDVIVCWRHNWPDCPQHLEVLELSRLMQSG